MQHAESYTLADSSSDPDIVAAAKQRADYWKYAPDSRYTVNVRIPGKPIREVSVTHDVDNTFTIKR